MERSSLESAVKQLAADLQPLAEKQLPIALALLAAFLATVLFFKARVGKEADNGSAVTTDAKRQFTKDEVAQHNKASDVWIVLKNKVYNVTPYVEEHPGGTAILRNAGADSTAGFYGPQHPERVHDLIEDFYIGDLADS